MLKSFKDKPPVIATWGKGTDRVAQAARETKWPKKEGAEEADDGEKKVLKRSHGTSQGPVVKMSHF